MATLGGSLAPEEDTADPEDDTADQGDDTGNPADATAAVPRVSATQRRCPNCEAPNSIRRTLCGRCGADMETGEVATGGGPITGPSQDTHGHTRDDLPLTATEHDHREDRMGTGRLAALIVALGVLLGAMFGGAVALGVGPFSGNGDGAEEEAPAPEFDPGRYEGEPESLTVTAIGTSTTSPPVGENSFDAAAMVDGELTTAWNNDGSQNPDGVAEIIAVEFGQPVWISEIVLANGAQQDDARFLGDARLRRARISFDGGQVFEATFLDRPALQAIQLPEPRLTTGVRIDVLETYPGDTYKDLAISELRFAGWPAEGADVQLGEDRAGG